MGALCRLGPENNELSFFYDLRSFFSSQFYRNIGNLGNNILFALYQLHGAKFYSRNLGKQNYNLT